MTVYRRHLLELLAHSVENGCKEHAMEFASRAFQTVTKAKHYDLSDYQDFSALFDAMLEYFSKEIQDHDTKAIYFSLLRQSKRQLRVGLGDWVIIKDKSLEPKNKPKRHLKDDLPRYALYLLSFLNFLFFLMMFMTKSGRLVVLSLVAFLLSVVLSIREARKVNQKEPVKPMVEVSFNDKKAFGYLENEMKNIDIQAGILSDLANNQATTEKADNTELLLPLLKHWDNLSEEIRAQAEDYMRVRRISCVEYSEKNKALFDVLPSNGNKTLEPAVIAENGTLLHRGVACLKEVR